MDNENKVVVVTTAVMHQPPRENNGPGSHHSGESVKCSLSLSIPPFQTPPSSEVTNLNQSKCTLADTVCKYTAKRKKNHYPPGKGAKGQW